MTRRSASSPMRCSTEIARLRAVDPAGGRLVGRPSMYQLRLVTGIAVSAKAL